MNDLLKQVLIGVTIAAIAGVWAFASTRASTASVTAVEVEIKELEISVDRKFEMIGNDLDELQHTMHRSEVQQSAFRAQLREKLNIED
tara:strand:- start:1005 stop:1268 length:264 start_codon:yes stop_codon:yes gene_type:complete